MSDESSRGRIALHVALGAGLALLLAPAFFFLLVLVSWLALAVYAIDEQQREIFLFAAAFLFIGIIQLVYIVPAILMARRRGRPWIATGLALGAAVILVPNIAFYFVPIVGPK